MKYVFSNRNLSTSFNFTGLSKKVDDDSSFIRKETNLCELIKNKKLRLEIEEFFKVYFQVLNSSSGLVLIIYSPQGSEIELFSDNPTMKDAFKELKKESFTSSSFKETICCIPFKIALLRAASVGADGIPTSPLIGAEDKSNSILFD